MKFLFTSSSYNIFFLSNSLFILFYSFFLLQQFKVFYFLMGSFLWTAWEYLYHRCFMHFSNKGKLYYFLHGHHHMYPNKNSIHIPLIQYICISVPFYYFVKYVFQLPHNENINYTLGHLTSLFLFENIHKEIHQPYFFLEDNGFKISHMYHHKKDKNKAYCFTSPLFDLLFNTFPHDVLTYNAFAFYPFLI